MKYILHLVCTIRFIFILFGLKIPQYLCIFSSSNPSSIYLTNGNLFVIHKTGIDIYDENLNFIKTSMTFSIDEQISTDKLSKIAISKFEDGYIVCLINDLIYIFDNEGNFKFKENSPTNRIIAGYYSLIGKKDNNQYNIYIFFIQNNIFFLRLYLYYKGDTSLFYRSGTELFGDEDNIFQNIGMSCHIMEHNIKGEVITCFYITTENGENYFRIRFFKNNSGAFVEIEISQSSFKNLNTNVNYLKTDINSDNSKALICFILSTGENYCFSYDINTDSFSSDYKCDENICRNEYYGLKVIFTENREFVFGCSGNNGNITLCIFDSNFNSKKKIIKLEECTDIEGYSIIYSNNENEYYILSDEACSGIANNAQDIQNTIFEIEEEKEEKIEEEIEEEKEEEKEKEKEEEKEEEIEEEKEEEKGEEIEEEKEEEKDEEKEEEIEADIEEKIEEEKEEEEEKENEKGEKEDEKEEKEDKKEQCQLEKCLKCDKKSISKNLCIKCNNIKGYYSIKISSSYENKIQEINDINYIDCFNDKTKPSRFYFNNISKNFEQCFERCASCEYGGNEKNNNCTSCDIGFTFSRDSKNLNNCVIKCPNYYYKYYGSYKCTITSQCPENYFLLIEEKKKCINNCSFDDIYKYQYNGECLKSCPLNTSDNNNDYKCKDINKDICSLNKKEIILSEKNIIDNDIGLIAKRYTNEFDYTDNHVSSFNILLYKNKEY